LSVSLQATGLSLVTDDLDGRSRVAMHRGNKRQFVAAL
jgi:hypothetical protein